MYTHQSFRSEEIGKLKVRLKENPPIDHMANYLKTVGNPMRLRILKLLSVYSEICVCDIAEILQITVPAVSQHLAKLKAGGLVATRRDAQTIYYSLSEHNHRPHLNTLLGVVDL